jgi:hypothetical protein
VFIPPHRRLFLRNSNFVLRKVANRPMLAAEKFRIRTSRSQRNHLFVFSRQRVEFVMQTPERIVCCTNSALLMLNHFGQHLVHVLRAYAGVVNLQQQILHEGLHRRW